jgi:type I pantothenate kinase
VIDAPARLAALVGDRSADAAGPVVVGIAGSVAAGKTTLASALRVELEQRDVATTVVGTDAFLFPNRVLSERGVIARKGFPETYDVVALLAFVDALRTAQDDVVIPVYSHETYDIVEDGRVTVRPADVDVVVIEGINTLGALAHRLDLAVYIDADEADLARWYVARFHELCRQARDDPTSFYRMFETLDAEEIEAVALETWRSVNLVVLRDHVAPTRALADVVVVKGPDHAVLELRQDVAPPAEEG